MTVIEALKSIPTHPSHKWGPTTGENMGGVTTGGNQCVNCGAFIGACVDNYDGRVLEATDYGTNADRGCNNRRGL